MDIGKAMTAAMQAQREQDQPRVTYSDLFTFERDGGSIRRVWLTEAEAMEHIA